MASNTRWKIYIGRNLTSDTHDDYIPTDAVDFTSRVRSFTCDEEVTFGEAANTSLTVVLDNSDGELTPGGTGTYGSYNWIGEPIWVRPEFLASGPTWFNFGYFVDVFGGFINDIRYEDDGFSSTVTLSAVDWFQVMAQAVFEEQYASTGALTFASVELTGIERFVPNLNTEQAAVVAVSEGHVAPLGQATQLISDLFYVFEVGESFGDAFSTTIGAQFATVRPAYSGMDRNPFPSGPTRSLHYRAIHPRNNPWSNQITGNKALQVVVMDADSPSDNTNYNIRFRNPQYGFQLDSLYNQATISAIGGLDEIGDNRPSQAARGVRAMVLTGLPFIDDEQSQELAQFIVNRFSDDTLIVESLEITKGMVDNADFLWQRAATVMGGASISNIYNLLHRPINIKFTGAGGQAVDQWVCFYQRTVEATPDDWTVTLSGGRNARSTMALVLDEVELFEPTVPPSTTTYFSTIGYNQTYEESGATYNTLTLGYDGTPYDGNRLG